MNTVQAFRETFTKYVASLQHRSAQLYMDKMNEYATMRKFSLDTVLKAGIFYIDRNAEMLVPEYLDNIEDFGIIAAGNKKPIYTERWVIPMKDQYGMVIGLVGWTYDSDAKYVFSDTKYFKRSEDVFGIDKTDEILAKDELIVVEGVADAIRIRDMGFDTVIATNGTSNSWYRAFIFNMANNVIFIPDRDRAGLETNNHWKSHKAIRLLIPPTDVTGKKAYKDVDEYVKDSEDNQAYCIEVIQSCFDTLRTKMSSGVVEVSMAG